MEKQTATEYHNLIGGKWVPAKSGQTFEDRNPAQWSEVVGIFPQRTLSTQRLSGFSLRSLRSRR